MGQCKTNEPVVLHSMHIQLGHCAKTKQDNALLLPWPQVELKLEVHYYVTKLLHFSEPALHVIIIQK